MFNNLTFYRINGKNPHAYGSAQEEAVAEHAFVPCGASQEKSTGFVPPRGDEHGDYIEHIVGQRILKFVVETKSVPSAVINAKAKEQFADIEATTGRKPGKKERREIKEDIKNTLLPMAFPKQSAVIVWINPVLNLLVLNTTSQARIDDVMSALVKVIDGFSVQLINTNSTPAAIMNLCLEKGGWVTEGDFTIDRECELKANDESKAVVKYAKHSLDITEIRDHIKQGKGATKLALTWKDRVSFVLTDTLQLKKVCFLDVVFESGREDKDSVDSFDADIAIATTELANLSLDLIDALGGEIGGIEKQEDEDEL